MQTPAANLSLSHRLAMKLRLAIKDGQYAPGSRLPATRELARRHKVSQNTVQGAFRELQALDLIECSPRQRGYVKLSASGREREPGLAQIGVINVMIPDDVGLAPDDWSTRILKSAERVLTESDYHLTFLSHYNESHEDLKEMLPLRIEQMGAHLSGMILFGFLENSEVLDLLDSRKIPWVSVNPIGGLATTNYVAADNLNGGRIVGRCFARLGYQRVLLLQVNTREVVSDAEKATGFVRGYIESGIPLNGLDYLSCGDWMESSGYKATLAYLDSHEPPQGIFTTGDLVALGAIRACRERGIDVPEQVGVVGATGLFLGRHSHPPLTVITQPMERMGAQAAEMLLEMRRKGIRRLPGRRISGKFILRDSLRIDDQLRREIESGDFE